MIDVVALLPLFHGLDTISRITLNGHLLDCVKNMHRTYVYEVKSLLRTGKNTLRLDAFRRTGL